MVKQKQMKIPDPVLAASIGAAADILQLHKLAMEGNPEGICRAAGLIGSLAGQIAAHAVASARQWEKKIPSGD